MPGIIHDVSTLVESLGRLDPIDAKRLHVAMDKGFYSEDNVDAMYRRHIRFWVGVPFTASLSLEAVERHRKLKKYGITKVVDSVTQNPIYEYADNPLSRLIGTAKESKFLEKCVSAGQLLTDKILVRFTAASLYRMFETGNLSATTKKILSTALI